MKKFLFLTGFIFCLSCFLFAGKFKGAPVLKVYKDPQLTNFFKRESGWIASDGGYSIPMDNGKVLWTFGDSYTNDYDKATGTVPCLFNVRNDCMLQPHNNWDWRQTKTVLGPKGSTLFHSDTAANHFNWPGSGIQVKDTAYVYVLNMKNVPTGMGFDYGGADAFAKLKLPEMTPAGYHVLQNFKGINFGIGFIKNEKDGYVYAYGQKSLSFGKLNIYVARFPISSPNADWAFWDGNAWFNGVDKAAAITTISSFSPNVVKVKDKYLIFSSAFSVGCDQGKDIYVAVSNSLTGPFSDKKMIYTIPDTVKGHSPFFYLPVGHPEYINDKDELLLTYSINGYGTCVPPCANNHYDPDYYRPRGIRIPLKLIDPGL